MRPLFCLLPLSGLAELECDLRAMACRRFIQLGDAGLRGLELLLLDLSLVADSDRILVIPGSSPCHTSIRPRAANSLMDFPGICPRVARGLI